MIDSGSSGCSGAGIWHPSRRGAFVTADARGRSSMLRQNHFSPRAERAERNAPEISQSFGSLGRYSTAPSGAVRACRVASLPLMMIEVKWGTALARPKTSPWRPRTFR